LKKYDDVLKDVDKKDYPLKAFLPLGLAVLDFTGYKYSSRYDSKLLGKLTELYGPKNSRLYLKIHLANHITMIILSLLFMVFIGFFASRDFAFMVISLLVPAAAVYASDRELNKKIKSRRLLIQIEFPDFLNKLTLLINAGMTISKAWETASLKSGKAGPLYELLALSLTEIKAGKPEYKAYEDFARNCRSPEISRAISLLLQNLRKGGFQVTSVLRLHANECWEMRKNAVKRIGEEASTKMVFPMALMLIAILIIAAAPAVLAMRLF